MSSALQATPLLLHVAFVGYTITEDILGIDSVAVKLQQCQSWRMNCVVL
jgi:hypothetical protein